MERLEVCLIRNFSKKRSVHHVSMVCCMSSTTETKVPSAINRDVIGPPNKVSNLRPVVFHVPKDESPLEKQFRLKKEEVQKWNELFWCKHNTNFFQQKEKFVAEHEQRNSPDNPPMSSDEMSVFYKNFLDENWKTHQLYNSEWYYRNIGLLVLALRVAIFKFVRKFKLDNTNK